MTPKLKNLAVVLCLTITTSSCYNSHNAENIIGKWQGTYNETCSNASRISSVEIEFTADKKFTAKITPPDGPGGITTGNYVIERYKLIFINNKKERDVQKIDNLSETQFDGSFGNDRCHGTTKLRKINS